MNGGINPNDIVPAVAPPANAIPPAPTGATIQQTSDTSYTLSWTNPGNIDGYVISYARDSVNDITSIDVPVERTSEQVINLVPNGNYEFNLYSQRNGIRNQEALTYLPPVVIPPGIITINELGEDFMNIIWDHDSTQGILTYAVTLFDSTGNTVVVPETLLNPVPNMSYRFNGLTPGTQYTIDVDIIITNGRSDFEQELQFTRPKPPENILLYQLSSTAVLFRWDPPSAPNNFFVDYVVSYSNPATNVLQEFVLPQGTSSRAIYGLQPGITYEFGVYTNIEPTRSSTGFTPIPLGTPNGTVNIGAVTARELEVLWIFQGQDVSSYIVRLFSENGLEEYSQTAAAGDSSTFFGNLTPDTQYITVVEAVSSTGVSSTVGSDSARTNTGTFTSAGTGTTNTVPNLQPQTTYSFSVVGNNGTADINIGTAVGTTDQKTPLQKTTNPLPQTTASSSTPGPTSSINYALYIAMAAVVLLLLFVICILLCYIKRRKSTSDPKIESRKREQTDARTETTPSMELGSLPPRPESRKYETGIERSGTREDRSDQGQLNHEYAEQPHAYMEIL